jgi:hypothetical protein
MTIKRTRALGAISFLVLGAVAMGCGEAPADESETVAPALSGQLPVAFQALSSHFLTLDQNGVCNTTGFPMASGTVPGLVTLPSGGLEFDWQSSNGDYWDDAIGQLPTDTGRLMQGGTSPSFAGCPSCVIPAFGFHSSNGNLWVGLAGPRSAFDTGGTMAGGTSPSIALFSNGTLALAFQGINGHLWVGLNGWHSGQDTGGVMRGGTSPSIAIGGPNNRVAIAFKGVNTRLWYGDGPFTGRDQGVVMSVGTSPSAAVSSDGSKAYVAFQNWDGTLWVEDATAGTFTATGIAMFIPWSPSIIPTPDGGYQVSAKGSNGHLWIYMSGQGAADQGASCFVN